jgi:hypothetical protein
VSDAATPRDAARWDFPAGDFYQLCVRGELPHHRIAGLSASASAVSNTTRNAKLQTAQRGGPVRHRPPAD